MRNEKDVGFCSLRIIKHPYLSSIVSLETHWLILAAGPGSKYMLVFLHDELGYIALEYGTCICVIDKGDLPGK